MAVLTILVVAGALLSADVPQGGPPGGTAAGGGSAEVTLALPAASAARPCPGLRQRPIPAAPALDVFRRPQGAPDGLPAFDGSTGTSWVPATTLLPSEVRRPGAGRLEAEVHLVPTVGVRLGGECDPDPSRDRGEGLCLTVGVGPSLVVRCFDEDAILAGRAIALTGPGLAHGFVPDGVARVGVRWPGGSR